MKAKQSLWSSTLSAFSTIYIKSFLSTCQAGRTHTRRAIVIIITDNLTAPSAPTLNTFRISSAHNNIISRLDFRLGLDEERGTSHLLGLVETHDLEDSRGDVTKDTVGLLQREALGSVGHDEGHLVQGVGSLGSLSLVEHLLSVTTSVLVKYFIPKSLAILTRGRK